MIDSTSRAFLMLHCGNGVCTPVPAIPSSTISNNEVAWITSLKRLTRQALDRSCFGLQLEALMTLIDVAEGMLQRVRCSCGQRQRGA